ncbi:MAG: ribonuclease Y [Candidatus Bipolaricaulota bacterium]|nr:ribonuclease Y [Candidatus Bipolaricaulota bacterium]MCS7273920.1 ribonuclease Y [Candidatus Bipolaricaulota bacterium]MDW8110793.1 ribonuclease Y [Candidatus Bipolaricaulota bacterium]MDW8328726.1 ribonuclease Y [Candidatus Bipolaricaulota bacterium]
MNPMVLLAALGVIVMVAVAVWGGRWWGRRQVERELARTGQEREQILAAAQREAEALKLAKITELNATYKAREEELERRIKRQEEKLERIEARLLKKEERLEQKGLELLRIEKSLKEDLKRLAALIEQGESLLEGERKRLEELSGLSAEQAKELLLRQIEEEAERFFAKRIRQIRERAEAEAERQARKIIATAIQRYASDEIESATMSHVPLPSEEYKGRVIGKEGRNIRAFEALTGVEVLVDDTPDAISLSGFHPVRREIARLAMEKLLEDGRIHPAQIKKQVEKAKERIAQRIKEEGQKALLELGIDGMHPALVELVGRLSFRTSYGQNQLRHSLEVAFIASTLAAELGLDAQMQRLAKRAGILHDIGKVVDHKVEGSHSLISAELARRYGEPEEVVHAIAAHNEEVEARTILAVLLQAADALSAARPGARQETFEAYIQRLQNLEEICHSFPGVQEAYAIQAGREVRVIVRPEEVDDDMAAKLSYDIARCIEEQMEYPGEIRVHVVRETSFVETAK